MKPLNVFRQSEKERNKKWQQSVSEDGKRRKNNVEDSMTHYS